MSADNGNGWVGSWDFIGTVYDIEGNHLNRVPGVVLASKREDIAAGMLTVAYVRQGPKVALSYLKALDDVCPAAAARIAILLRQMPLPDSELIRGLSLTPSRGP